MLRLLRLNYTVQELKFSLLKPDGSVLVWTLNTMSGRLSHCCSFIFTPLLGGGGAKPHN